MTAAGGQATAVVDAGRDAEATGATGAPVGLPRCVEVETSRRCNRSCTWCPNGEHTERRRQELMDWTLFRRIVDELGTLRYGGWLAFHNYHEPLLNRRLMPERAHDGRVFGTPRGKGKTPVAPELAGCTPLPSARRSRLHDVPRDGHLPSLPAGNTGRVGEVCRSWRPKLANPDRALYGSLARLLCGTRALSGVSDRLVRSRRRPREAAPAYGRTAAGGSGLLTEICVSDPLHASASSLARGCRTLTCTRPDAGHPRRFPCSSSYIEERSLWRSDLRS
jgi:hypothetical protein